MPTGDKGLSVEHRLSVWIELSSPRNLYDISLRRFMLWLIDPIGSWETVYIPTLEGWIVLQVYIDNAGRAFVIGTLHVT